MESWFLEPFHFPCAIMLLINSCTVEEILYFGIYISWFAFQLVWWMSLNLMCFFSWYLSCKYWFLLLFYYCNKIQRNWSEIYNIFFQWMSSLFETPLKMLDLSSARQESKEGKQAAGQKINNIMAGIVGMHDDNKPDFLH